MTTRKTKKKVLDIIKGCEVEVEVDGAAEKTLEAHGMFDLLEKAKQGVMPNFSPLDLNMAKGSVHEDPFAYRDSRSVDEVINMEYPGLLRDRDQSSILIAILKELVRARRG